MRMVIATMFRELFLLFQLQRISIGGGLKLGENGK